MKVKWDSEKKIKWDSGAITCMVVDLGLYVELARTLGKSYKKVYYCNPSWPAAFPKMNQAYIGSGFDEIEICQNPMDHFDDIDLYVFPDIGHGELQEFLASQGKNVWGARTLEKLEFERAYTKEKIKSSGLPVGPWQKVTGMDSLRDHLKKKENQWVKVDRWRGLFETFFSKNYAMIEPRLDEIEHSAGAFKSQIDFIVEDDLPDRFEVAIDAYNIDGQIPGKLLYGVEIKDLGYVGKFVSYDDTPRSLRKFDYEVRPMLKKGQFRSFYSPEQRIGKDGKAYMIDLCARAPSPPNELYQVFYKNLAQIIEMGAKGKCVNPVPAAKWGAEIMIHSPWATKNWQPIEFPSKYADFVKLRNAVKIDGKSYTMPQTVELPEIGAVVGYGNSMEAAIEMCTEIADSVHGYYVEIPKDSMERAKEEIDKAKDFGVWTD